MPKKEKAGTRDHGGSEKRSSARLRRNSDEAMEGKLLRSHERTEADKMEEIGLSSESK